MKQNVNTNLTLGLYHRLMTGFGRGHGHKPVINLYSISTSNVGLQGDTNGPHTPMKKSNRVQAVISRSIKCCLYKCSCMFRLYLSNESTSGRNNLIQTLLTSK